MSLKSGLVVCCAAVLGGVVGAGIVLSEVRAQGQSQLVGTPKTLTTKAIELTDANDQIRFKISAESGSPICFFYDPAGCVRMRIGLSGQEENYTPFIAMNDKNRHERLGIGIEDKEDNQLTSYLRLRDSEGRTRLLTSFKEGFGPSYSLLDNSGTLRGSLMQFDEKRQNAGLFLANPATNDYAQLLVSELGSSLLLTSGKASLGGRSDKAIGTNLLMSDSNGNLKMRLNVEKDGATQLWRFGKGVYGYIDKQVERDFKKEAAEVPKIEVPSLHGYPKLEGH
ncbi:hypothetical protein BH11CYA1_BH11CYA1_11610 [soil metagenome]